MSNEQELSIEELLRVETEARLKEMGKPDYEFPAKVTQTDFAIMIAGGLVSVLLIILCMLGVIV